MPPNVDPSRVAYRSHGRAGHHADNDWRLSVQVRQSRGRWSEREETQAILLDTSVQQDHLQELPCAWRGRTKSCSRCESQERLAWPSRFSLRDVFLAQILSVRVIVEDQLTDTLCPSNLI